jgi:hypothetical protein
MQHKIYFSQKSAAAFVIAGVLLLGLVYAALAYFFTSSVPRYEEPQTGTSYSETTPSPAPSITPTVIPKPTVTAAPKPSATTKPVSTKMFKITAPTTWDTQKTTRYFFEAYPYVPIKTITIKFNGSEFELTAGSNGNFSKVIDIPIGQTVITVTALAESGKTETQTYTVTKNDTLHQVESKLVGVQCDGAKLDECRNFSGYSEGKCNKLTLYLECLRTKCDVNTLSKDPYCKSQY